MKTRYNYSNYGNDLHITIHDAQKCSQSGDMEQNILDLMQKRYIKRQISTLNPECLKRELKECGAWGDDELNDQQQNIVRFLWLSCCDISERSK